MLGVGLGGDSTDAITRPSYKDVSTGEEILSRSVVTQRVSRRVAGNSRRDRRKECNDV